MAQFAGIEHCAEGRDVGRDGGSHFETLILFELSSGRFTSHNELY